jgi:hypothetical protein
MRLIASALFVAVAATSSQAAVLYNTAGSTYSENFNTLAIVNNTNPWVNDVTIPGWYAFRQPSPGIAMTQYRTDNGTSNTGNIYSFGATGTPTNSTERAFGSIGSSGAAYGSPTNSTNTVIAYWGVQITNNTGGALENLTVTYDMEQWRDGGNATAVAQPLVSSWAINPTDTFAAIFSAGASTNSPVFTNTGAGAPVDGNGVGLVANVSFVIPGPLAAGETLWVRFRELNDSGNDHGMAVDNFRFTASAVVVPEPASIGLLALGALAGARRSRR